MIITSLRHRETVAVNNSLNVNVWLKLWKHRERTFSLARERSLSGPRNSSFTDVGVVLTAWERNVFSLLFIKRTAFALRKEARRCFQSRGAKKLKLLPPDLNFETLWVMKGHASSGLLEHDNIQWVLQCRKFKLKDEVLYKWRAGSWI